MSYPLPTGATEYDAKYRSEIYTGFSTPQPSLNAQESTRSAETATAPLTVDQLVQSAASPRLTHLNNTQIAPSLKKNTSLVEVNPHTDLTSTPGLPTNKLTHPPDLSMNANFTKLIINFSCDELEDS